MGAPRDTRHQSPNVHQFHGGCRFFFHTHAQTVAECYPCIMEDTPFQLDEISAAPPPPKRARMVPAPRQKVPSGSRGLEVGEMQVAGHLQVPSMVVDSLAWIPATASNFLTMESHRKHLLLKPQVSSFHAEEGPQEYPVYRKKLSGTRQLLGVPRYYGLHAFHTEQVTYSNSLLLAVPMQEGVTFAGKLSASSPPQQEAFNAIITQLQAQPVSGGMLVLPCGFGKTVISIAIAAHLQVRTLVIVHQEFLMDQWVERIRTFMPAARVGRIQQHVCDVEGCTLNTATMGWAPRWRAGSWMRSPSRWSRGKARCSCSGAWA